MPAGRRATNLGAAPNVQDADKTNEFEREGECRRRREITSGPYIV
jgi:hypothetical protein